MSNEAEVAFVKKLVGVLAEQPVTYGDDYQPPLDQYLKKVPVLPVDVPPPPQREGTESGPVGAISVTIKSVKPARTYTLSIHPSDTISTVKSQLASLPGAPPAESIRLLLKGKALVDAKLLQEYDVKDGDTINLMVRSNTSWDSVAGAAATGSTAATPSASGTNTPAIVTTAEPESIPEQIVLVAEHTAKTSQGHKRIPSVVLSPSPSLTPVTDEKLVDIPLTLDTSSLPPTSASDTSYHARISQPEFWERLYEFLQTQFATQNDIATAWEDFFCASKGSLSVSEIAKIRDNVGVSGMAGT